MSKNINTDDRQHLDSVSQFLNTSIQWTPLQTSGSTNRLFQAVVDGRSLILRINAVDNLAFGVSRKTEASMLELIQAYNWAPQIIKNNWQAGWCLMLDHGATIESERLPSGLQEIASMLLEAVHEWQLVHLDTLLNNECTFNYQHLFEMYRSAFKSTPNNTDSQDKLCLTDNVENKLNALPVIPNCLTHHDLHPGNICKKDNQLVILDWEYAGIGNPWFDAAALHSKFRVSDEEIASLPAFKKLSKAQLKQGLTKALELTRLLENLWVSVREK